MQIWNRKCKYKEKKIEDDTLQRAAKTNSKQEIQIHTQNGQCKYKFKYKIGNTNT